MEPKHLLKTYLRFYSNGDVNDIANELNRRGYKPVVISNSAEICVFEENTYDVNLLLRKTIADFKDDPEELKSLCERFNCKLFLTIVAELYTSSPDPYPILSLDPDIVDFLYHSSAQMDLDYYIYKEEGEK